MQTTVSMNEPMLQEREEAISNLEADVRAVAHLFQDVALMVQTQREQIDHIQSHMEVAAAHTDRAALEIARIEQRRRRLHRRRWWRCACACCCAIGAGIAFLLVQHRFL